MPDPGAAKCVAGVTVLCLVPILKVSSCAAEDRLHLRLTPLIAADNLHQQITDFAKCCAGMTTLRPAVQYLAGEMSVEAGNVLPLLATHNTVRMRFDVEEAEYLHLAKPDAAFPAMHFSMLADSKRNEVRIDVWMCLFMLVFPAPCLREVKALETCSSMSLLGSA